MDADGYPDEDELERIRGWELKARTDFVEALAFVRERWMYPDYWREIPGWFDDSNKRVTRYEISTGGWSGNEDLMSAMQDNRVLWLFCWVQSRRGGHYVFELSEEMA